MFCPQRIFVVFVSIFLTVYKAWVASPQLHGQQSQIKFELLILYFMFTIWQNIGMQCNVLQKGHTTAVGWSDTKALLVFSATRISVSMSLCLFPLHLKKHWMSKIINHIMNAKKGWNWQSCINCRTSQKVEIVEHWVEQNWVLCAQSFMLDGNPTSWNRTWSVGRTAPATEQVLAGIPSFAVF